MNGVRALTSRRWSSYTRNLTKPVAGHEAVMACSGKEERRRVCQPSRSSYECVLDEADDTEKIMQTLRLFHNVLHNHELYVYFITETFTTPSTNAVKVELCDIITCSYFMLTKRSHIYTARQHTYC